MSKLRDRLRETSRARRGAGLGFAPERSAKPPASILVIAAVSDPAAASAAVDAGARALLYCGATDGVAATVEAAGDAPVGCRIEAATAEQARDAAEAGADFLLLDDARASAAALLERRLGRVVLLEPDAAEERLRALATLGADALVIEPPPEPLTVRAQLRLRRVAELTRSTLIVAATAAVTAVTLETWRDAGAPAVLLPEGDLDALVSAVAAAREVPPPRPRNDGARALVPGVAAPAERHEEDDEPDLEPAEPFEPMPESPF